MTRLVVPVIVALVGLQLVTPTARALEKTSVRVDTTARDTWAAAGTCTLRYYNTCNGWAWAWGDWSHGEQFGVAFHSCCESAVLQLTQHFIYFPAPSGWGYTGTIDVYAADANECPTGSPLASQPYQAPTWSTWSVLTWGVPVPEDFVVQITYGGVKSINWASLLSDHPATGPTGPQACGLCFPSTRQTHSYSYGYENAPLCPGVRFNDGTCDVEFLFEAALECPVHTDKRSWGGIKELYR